MPFGTPQPPQQQQGRDPMYRLGGLFPSKTGTSLGGNVPLDMTTRDTGGQPFGEFLINLIRQGIAEGRPLRFVVFESTKADSKVPYTLQVMLGNPKMVNPEPAPYQPPYEQGNVPPQEYQPYAPTAQQPQMPSAPVVNPNWPQPQAERVPTPMRPRTAPRRP